LLFGPYYIFFLSRTAGGGGYKFITHIKFIIIIIFFIQWPALVSGIFIWLALYILSMCDPTEAIYKYKYTKLNESIDKEGSKNYGFI